MFYQFCTISVGRGAETRRGWGIYPPNNFTVSPPIVWVWSTSASPPKIWLWCASKRRCPLEFGEKNVPFFVKTFFLVFTWIWAKKGFHFSEDFFFYGLHLICSPEQNRGRGSSPPMLKIGQNWGKIANYPSNAQQRSAPLSVVFWIDMQGIFSVGISMGQSQRSCWSKNKL